MKEFYKNFKKAIGNMQQECPDTVSGFMGLFEKTMDEGALSVKQKEAVALGIAVPCQCMPCIRLHVKKAADAGLTREQILETAGVTVMMCGGPAYTHIPEVMEALDALEIE
ncbi:MAG: carboxymuconolactone decarboxylase family protein [Candidatus Brocadiia bacterium]